VGVRPPGLEVVERPARLKRRGTLSPSFRLAPREDTSTVRRALAGGLTEFTEKPIDAPFLMGRIATLLKAASLASPGSVEKPLGTVMVEQGTLTPEPVDAIIKLQAANNLSFGELAEEMYGVAEEDVWRARAQQILGLLPIIDVDSEVPHRDALDLITADEAATYWLLPLRLDHGRLVMVTSAGRLAGALIKCDDIFKRMPVKFAIAAPRRLRAAIAKEYGVTPQSVDPTDLLNDLQARPNQRPAEPAPHADEDDVTIRCVWCDEPVHVDRKQLGERIGCPSCGEPTVAMLPETVKFPTPKPVAPASAAASGKPTDAADSGIRSNAPVFGDVSAADLHIRFGCEACGERLKITAAYAGKRVKCPRCGDGTTVPSTASSPRIFQINIAGQTQSGIDAINE